jgi:predicted GNAT family N-acyltransferase
MLIKLIETGTKEYDEMTNLRKRGLLDPYGIPHYYINPEKEKDDFLIGAFDEQLVGCCMLTKKDDVTLQLRQMVVDSAHQKSGVGAAIVAFAENVAREHGFQKMILHARDTAKGFYSKYSYKIVGEEFFEVGLRHFKMEKEIRGI